MGTFSLIMNPVYHSTLPFIYSNFTIWSGIPIPSSWFSPKVRFSSFNIFLHSSSYFLQYLEKIYPVAISDKWMAVCEQGKFWASFVVGLVPHYDITHGDLPFRALCPLA